jgi:carboxypeptidase Q
MTARGAGVRRRIARAVILSMLAMGAACTIRRPGERPIPVGVAGGGRSVPPPAAVPLPDTAVSVAQTHLTIAPEPAAVRAMLTQGIERSHIGADLEYLSDVIGPRLTGSPAGRRATDWTVDKFREYGADSTWTEPFRFGRSWERGPIALTLLAPHAQQLIGASWAWAPGTAGATIGDVVYVDALTPAEYDERFATSVKGKWVMTRGPNFVWNSDGPPMSVGDTVAADSAARAFAALTSSPDLVEFRTSMPARLAHDGALGLLSDGGKEFGLLTMSGSPMAPYPLPFVVLPHDTYAMFHRLLAIGQKVTVRADIANSLGPDVVDAANTVAEIRGTSAADQVVLLGAHLDSWDLATGATDNGAGAMVVLEAARILKAAGVHPVRTIRFVLFTGEEEGLLGSQWYADRHAAELKRYQAVLVIDNGTGRVTGMSLQGRNELRDAWRGLLAPVDGLGPFAVRSREKTGTDHLSFLPYGVPAFNFDQETRGYNHTHHSQADTYDHIVVGDLRQAATVMAVTAYELATTPEFLSRGPARIVVGGP